MAKGSTSVGQSGLPGESEFNSKPEQGGTQILNQVIQFHENVINRGILEWHKRIQTLGRQEIYALEEFSTMKKG